jgi:hypothetical protein
MTLESGTFSADSHGNWPGARFHWQFFFFFPETVSLYVAQASLKLTTPLPQPPK